MCSSKAERRVPLPDSLVQALTLRHAANPDSLYLFPNKQGRPNGHFLRMPKKLAKRAGLNCGECFNVGNGKKQSCSKGPVCDKFELHKFRCSFATLHHEAGVLARQIQQWLGHSDLTTTLRYPAISDDRNQRTRDRVNNSFVFLQEREEPVVSPPSRYQIRSFRFAVFSLIRADNRSPDHRFTLCPHFLPHFFRVVL